MAKFEFSLYGHYDEPLLELFENTKEFLGRQCQFIGTDWTSYGRTVEDQEKAQRRYLHLLDVSPYRDPVFDHVVHIHYEDVSLYWIRCTVKLSLPGNGLLHMPLRRIIVDIQDELVAVAFKLISSDWKV